MAGRGRQLLPINPTNALLIAHGISRREFAEMIDLHPHNVTNYATGLKPWPQKKIQLAAEILGVTPNMLRGEEPIPGLEDAEWDMHETDARKWNRLSAEHTAMRRRRDK